MLAVRDLCKGYDKFYLDHVSFSLDKGYIMGFIGANGAGKTTTLKGLMNLIHTDGGKVEIGGRDFSENEMDLKQDVGFMLGGSRYYPKRKLKEIAKVVRRFYSRWDDRVYAGYLDRFNLDGEKRIEELSQGMAVKFSLALALSHRAELLILDEPTSGLDPVARDNLLELFQELVESGERSILFSTHITSDLEKCADFITFIGNGRIVNSTSKDDFIDAYRMISGTPGELESIREDLVSFKENSFGFTGMAQREAAYKMGIEGERPTLEEIMIYHAKGEDVHV